MTELEKSKRQIAETLAQKAKPIEVKPETDPETESKIDKVLRDTFPASDPPAWSAIADHKKRKRH